MKLSENRDSTPLSRNNAQAPILLAIGLATSTPLLPLASRVSRPEFSDSGFRADRSDRLEQCVRASALGSQLLAEPLAFHQVAEHRVGEERLGPPVRGPLKLVVTMVHVFDQVFHPEQGVPPVSHRGVS